MTKCPLTIDGIAKEEGQSIATQALTARFDRKRRVHVNSFL